MYKVRVCRGPTCGDERHSHGLADEFRRQLAAHRLGNVELEWQSCFGRCSKGPNVLVRKLTKRDAQPRFVIATPPLSRGGKATMYNHVTTDDVLEIVSMHLRAGRPVRRLMERPPGRQKTGEPNKDGEE